MRRPPLPLPIDPHLDAIVARVRAARAAVVVAAPGAGKTTRVPPALAGDGPAIVLQPRRVAARAIAARIAFEQGWTLGDEVGWHVRFERRFSAGTRVLLATEGILTARLLQDPLLSDFRTIVLDEFHERSLHADLGLALARQAWRARDDLRIVVMSATIDPAPVTRFLDDCPVIDVPGREHPVEITYLPREPLARAVERMLPRSIGTILCFLPGAPEIRREMTAIARGLPGVEVVPLHGSLTAEEQDAVVNPATIRAGGALSGQVPRASPPTADLVGSRADADADADADPDRRDADGGAGPGPATSGVPALARRRVILATNIAETSLTVPGVTAVIDTGLHKVARYDAARGIDSLEVERVSQDSADQRAGRAGRLGPGVAWRLWDAHDRLRPQREPDIVRVDLAATLLDLLAWGGDPDRFEWYEAPPRAAIEAAWTLLRRLGAVDVQPDTRQDDGPGQEDTRPDRPPDARPDRQPAVPQDTRPVRGPGQEDTRPDPRHDARQAARHDARHDAPHDARPDVQPGDPREARLDLDAPVRADTRHADTKRVDTRRADAKRAAPSLTVIGRQLQRLPLHPRLGRILLAAGGARDAARTCALLAERHYLAPRHEATTCDLLAALDRWADVPPHVHRVARDLEQWAARLPRSRSDHHDAVDARMSDVDLRRAIFAGYPDRVARRRVVGSPRVLLASGHGAVVSGESGVQDGEFLVALDVQAAQSREGSREVAEARIRMASLVDRTWLTPTARVVHHWFDAEAGRVKAARRDLYDEIVLAEHAVEPDPEATAPVLADAYLARGLRDADHQLLRRLRFAGRPIDAAVLVARAARVTRSLDAIDLAAQLARDESRDLDRLAPETLRVPSGRTTRLTYEEEGGVSAAVKLQELFGLAETPRIGPRQTPVVLQLLAPNGRPVQTTRDLRSFWDRTYPDVRKELRGRYPKHPWPDDPWTATPTARTTRRGDRSGR